MLVLLFNQKLQTKFNQFLDDVETFGFMMKLFTNDLMLLLSRA